MAKLTITILIDNPRSWFMSFGQELERKLRELGHTVVSIQDPNELASGDIAFILSCEQIIGSGLRSRNTHNLVIHASALPEGKGWSPTTWKILEGKNEIPLTLFEAADKVDAGDIYMTSAIHLEGYELIDEVRRKEGSAIIELALAFVEAYPKVVGRPQEGKESFYKRRTPKDSELDPRKTIAEQFELLRVVDNEQYPAFFTHRGHRYILKIYEEKER